MLPIFKVFNFNFNNYKNYYILNLNDKYEIKIENYYNIQNYCLFEYDLSPRH